MNVVKLIIVMNIKNVVEINQKIKKGRRDCCQNCNCSEIVHCSENKNVVELNQKRNVRIGEIVVKILDVVKLFRVAKYKPIVEMNQNWDMRIGTKCL